MENQKKSVIRVGSTTFGIMMILIGISIFLQTISSLNLFRFTLSLWPIVFICLGTEILYYSHKKDVELKYDVLGVLTIFIILFFSVIFSVTNYGINKILYDEDVKSQIIESFLISNREYVFKDKVIIDTKGNENITVRFIENKYEEDVFVKAKINYDETKNKNLIKLLNNQDIKHDIFYPNYTQQKIRIFNIPKIIKDIQITVIANDKSKLIYSGEIIY